MVYRAGVGPEPCPVDKLTASILVEKLELLTHKEVQRKAKELSVTMNQEDGVKGGLDHFLSGLPRDNMLCDVSLVLGETNLARYSVTCTNVKISLEIAALVQEYPLCRPKTFADYFVNCIKSFNFVLAWINPNSHVRQKRHGVTTYALGRVQTVAQGLVAGWFGMFHLIIRGLVQIYVKSDRFARSHGSFGCLFGLIISPLYVLWYVFRGVVTFFDRILVGFANGVRGKNKLYIIDPSVQATVYQTSSGVNALLYYELPSAARQSQLKKAMRITNNARKLWVECKPDFPNDHWHWKEVSMKLLKVKVIKNAREHLSILDEEYDTLIRCLNACPLEAIGFSRFCLFLGEAVQDRLQHKPIVDPSIPMVTLAAEDPHTISGHVITPIGDLDDDEDAEVELLSKRKTFVFSAKKLTPVVRTTTV
jgi:hypothetical protein